MSVAPPPSDDCPLRGVVEPETLLDPELSELELLVDERASGTSMLLPVVLPALLVRSPEVAAEPVLVVPALTREVPVPVALSEVESLPEVAPDPVTELLPLVALPVALEFDPEPPLDEPAEPD